MVVKNVDGETIVSVKGDQISCLTCCYRFGGKDNEKRFKCTRFPKWFQVDEFPSVYKCGEYRKV